jgi:tripartite-type tricarboxylate transporter receptor subunit TctC
MVMTPEAFDKYTRDDIAQWARVIKRAGITVD